MKSFQHRLEQYAALAVEVGVNVQPGQKLCIISQIAAADFVREVARRAYEIGASYVHVDWSDELLTRTRLEKSPEEGLSYYPEWHAKGRVALAEEGAAFLWVVAENPDLLNGIDASRVGLATKAQQAALQPFRKFTLSNEVSWSIVAVPTPEWAEKVFPALPASDRVDALWEAIFAATRVDANDPVQSWREHADNLRSKAGRLNERNYKELRYRNAVGTEVSIGLPEGHIWVSAGTRNKQGTTFIPNMPTEEVFTSPLRTAINGKVVSSKPLSYNGNLIDRFSITFKEGRITEYTAEVGYDALKGLIETDEGSHYLGEIALVPFQSPISDTNLTFYNTLFDENAACHLAIGFAFPFCIEGGLGMSKDELSERGLNQSLTHVDFMIGTADLDIDGVRPDGSVEPLFRGGNWAF
ncbi:aminopeptidase [Paenibacillus montanisoli]|uniref:Aminopeptidase n=1 Tax=Paenibacillus montanisoli TaxID=2081970 RepID=A0A328U9Z6_9BACL|nr:aminopeptidase [Paenibacillus montanisoli]RAP78171.1 aminopeptidase [Paenibacillus montanisoli]